MNNKTLSNRKESDVEYSNLMLDYIKNKYSKDFVVVETLFPKEGFNTSMKVNTLVVKEVETEIIVNVHAALEKPYNFYDNYADSLAGYLLRSKVDSSFIEEKHKSKLYVYLKDKNIDDIDISDRNISKATFVININAKPNEDTLKKLFMVYEELCKIECSYVFMIVGFTQEEDVLTKYVNNFSYYGDKYWEDYSNNVYATMNVSEKGINYTEFSQKCVECR